MPLYIVVWASETSQNIPGVPETVLPQLYSNHKVNIKLSVPLNSSIYKAPSSILNCTHFGGQKPISVIINSMPKLGTYQ